MLHSPCVMFRYVFLCLLFFYLLQNNVNCSKYDYLIFENFVVVKDIFIDEQHRISILRDILKEKTLMAIVVYKSLMQSAKYAQKRYRSCVMKILLDKNFPLMYPISLLEPYLVSNFENNYNNDNSSVVYVRKNHVFNMSWQSIIEGAQKGIVMLHETFGLNIKEFANGMVNKPKKYSHRSTDSLKSEDLASMAVIAVDVFGWYDNSVVFVNEALSRLIYAYDVDGRYLPNEFHSLLVSMKNKLINIHNKMFVKKQRYIGYNWKLFSNVVSNGNNIQISDMVYHNNI